MRLLFMHWLSDRLAPRLEYISRFCSQPIATIEMKKSAVEKELGKGNNSSLEYIAGAYEQLHAVLVSDYPWTIREAEKRISVELLDGMEHTKLKLQNMHP